MGLHILYSEAGTMGALSLSASERTTVLDHGAQRLKSCLHSFDIIHDNITRYLST